MDAGDVLEEPNANGVEVEEEEVNGYKYDKSLDLRRRGSHRHSNGVIQPLLTGMLFIWFVCTVFAH